MGAVALLVFREVLEAALIVSVVAAATRGVPRRGWFIGGGIALGGFGAVLVALSADLLAAAFSGVGQELFNAGVLLAAVLMIGWHVLWMSSHGRELSRQMQLLGNAVHSGASSLGLLLAVVALAVLREGSEVVLFLYGMRAGGAEHLWAGLAIGVVAGAALGFALYAGLLRIPLRHFFGVTNAMLVLLAAGLASTAARYLIQADLLPAWGNQLWDSSWLLGNGSVPGQTAHILVGYDAQPAGMQLVFYALTLLALWMGARFVKRQPPTRPLDGRPAVHPAC
ncbi:MULTISPECIES: FTR1 family iron permease [Rhodanobacter]|uniref:High-affinity Fe2+/Pb2+ permease n=1 Tax=Rhodanobacter denitrificans TaxID=666685 RepID=M4NFM0_9GAMM|nr:MULTISPECIES: FTR1 family protein [Rhodanobacter]AGG89654.1 high-affinity Fe2+/Pb2+ permease [Rhodanobacter denitrificans]KZC19505.1 iron permease [Rhodanobacter denitrificans]UJM85052.1 FTR1 family protein [Rhodanobacter denitrificans]UJM92567.1 FTR1 family protein [Rhodanobacter denitrificans]UJM96097.1 FTR1 family protein [Rhodanobacter denitrificans]